MVFNSTGGLINQTLHLHDPWILLSINEIQSYCDILRSYSASPNGPLTLLFCLGALLLHPSVVLVEHALLRAAC